MDKYKYLLWDLDGTLIDFKIAESTAVRKLFHDFGYGECTDEMLELYSNINRKYWAALERKEITKPEVLTGRFLEFFTRVGVPTDRVDEFNKLYQPALGDTIIFNDDSPKVLRGLKDKYVLALVTNGTKIAQTKKLNHPDFKGMFDYSFISEDLGAEKPSPDFFEKVFDVVGIEDKSQALIIGDSLTSDILGGNLVGIDTCWYNPNRTLKDKDVEINYEIHNLNEIHEVLK